MLLEVTTQQQATKLLKQTRNTGLVIKATPHRSLNSSDGVILETNLVDEMKADFVEDLENWGFSAVRPTTVG